MSNVVTAIFRNEQQIAEMLRQLADMADRGELRSAVVVAETDEHWIFRTALHQDVEGASLLGAIQLLSFQVASHLSE